MAFRGVNFVHAWANVNTTGSQDIRDSYNIASIDDLGLGRTRFNFSTNANDINYTFSSMSGNDGTTTAHRCQMNDAAVNVGHFSLRSRSRDGVRDDNVLTVICVADN